MRYVSFEDIPEREIFEAFVKETYERNGVTTIPKITGISFGDASEPVNIINLDGGMSLYHGISWADKENDAEFRRAMARQLEEERREALEWARIKCYDLLEKIDKAKECFIPDVEVAPIVETIVESFRKSLRLFWENAKEYDNIETLIDWCSDAPTTLKRYSEVCSKRE